MMTVKTDGDGGFHFSLTTGQIFTMIGLFLALVGSIGGAWYKIESAVPIYVAQEQYLTKADYKADQALIAAALEKSDVAQNGRMNQIQRTLDSIDAQLRENAKK
jgi:hypothetical protein